MKLKGYRKIIIVLIGLIFAYVGCMTLPESIVIPYLSCVSALTVTCLGGNYLVHRDQTGKGAKR